MLFGKIPASLASCVKLDFLAMRRNFFQGDVPSSLESLRGLEHFDISNNNFSGNIPKFLKSFDFLQLLNLSYNHFEGEVPTTGVFKNANATSIQGNGELCGSIPKFQLPKCNYNKSKKKLTLTVKLIISILSGLFGVTLILLLLLLCLEHFDLSNNNFSGNIPKFLESFDFLQLLNLSYNHFEGEVTTTRVFENANATSIQGNGELCGGIPKFQLPKCNYNKSKKKLTLTMKLIISILFGLFGVTLILLLLLLCSLRKKRKKNTSIDSINFLLNVSYQSLLNATNGFSSANLIGKGSFGSVYKGILDQGRNMVAVKVLNLSRHGASKSFMAECEALRHIRHRNLVKVLTTCSGIDYQGHDFKALVYEFLGNGNLDEWLHPTPRTNEAIEEPRKLSLLQRLNIAIDVASAFDYLHHRCETPIVHCDLKPSNVLLDDDLIGHVGDFGLARFLHDVSQDCFANQSSSIGVKGTVGYTPPEYGMGNEVSVYDDIYSYDILLLEMFTGKRPTDNIFQDNLNLLDFVKAALSKRKIDIIDPNLLWEKQEEETRRINNTRNEDQNGSSKIQECLILILGIGVACSTEFPTKRMNISTVVVELHKIRESILKTIIQRQRVRTTGAQG
ncbi:probable LRR receptor-like serine/threonine-protein kinase At3g47570 isoform X1 [Quercus suber]|uniref:probable LRR receptor-like serine/threonine-protein kinase At3g47570 isoform X1 n=1 Tax=Quercus suber TaxID=58331 RepID=UPI000CE2399C|nr:probable LRR receptor-like serine/threonine-protein kinase At3g47570 [Quercus suber]